MRAWAAAVYLFLYLPIGLIVLFSFSAGRHASDFRGFSLQWYGRALSNPFVLEALGTSLVVAFASALLATLFGAMAALGLDRLEARTKAAFEALVYVALMIPGIVIGIATLVALASAFELINPVLAAAMGEAAPRLGLGRGSLVAAHGVFSLALVVVIVRARLAGMDRSLVEASADLYAPPLATFLQVTLPQIAPAVLAGFLLSFTFSFDDFIVAFFVAGAETTLPIYVFSSIRRGVTPEINAIGSMVLAVSLVLLVGAQLLLRRGPRPAPEA